MRGRLFALSRTLRPRPRPHALERLLQAVRALAQPLALFIRHFRFEHLADPGAADAARQRQRNAKLLLVAADRNDRALVIEHHLGDAGRDDADSVLAGIMPLDDADVGVAHLALQLLPQLADPLAARAQQ